MSDTVLLAVGGLVVLAIVMIAFKAVGRRGEANTPYFLSEADVFMRYGQKNEAINALKKALRNDPDNASIQAKLKEIKDS